jgi:hypothetical protein
MVTREESRLSRQLRSDYKSLLDEARAIELLAEETEVAADRIAEYWSTSADLINLVAEIDELEPSGPTLTFDDPRLSELRRRLRTLAARLVQLASE